AAGNAASALDQFRRMIGLRQPLPDKAPADGAWLNPFGPLTTKAAKAAKPPLDESPIRLRSLEEVQAALKRLENGNVILEGLGADPRSAFERAEDTLKNMPPLMKALP